MFMRKVYNYRLKTNTDIEQLLLQFSGCNRFAWNNVLALQKDSLDKTRKILPYNQLTGCLVKWKKDEDTSFLKTAPSQTFLQTLKVLYRALKDAFEKKQTGKKSPVLKTKCVYSNRYTKGFRVEVNRSFLSNIEWVRFQKSRDMQGAPRYITIFKRVKYWFASIQTEQDIQVTDRPLFKPFNDVVGIDMDMLLFLNRSEAFLSSPWDGEYIEPLNSFKKLQKKLARAQRILAGKMTFSCNWKKPKQDVSKIHIKMADANFLQKLSTIMSKNITVIVAEDVRIKNMTASFKDDMKNPGKKVKAQFTLDRSILDQGWSSFLRMVGYKQTCSGGKFIQMGPKNTSRTCTECSHVSGDHRKINALFKCGDCGYTANVDHIAAVNIKARGIMIESGGGKHGISRQIKKETVEKSDQVTFLCSA